MRFLHGSIDMRGHCAIAETLYLQVNEGTVIRFAARCEQNRKETKMVQSIITRQGVAASLGEELRRAFNVAMQRIADYRAYRRTIRELSDLSAHDLADLGLHHSEIRRIARESVYGTRR